MELFLYRVYDESKEKRFLFSEEARNVDVFTLRYANNDEMLNYFNRMPKVYKENETVEQGRFAVFKKVEKRNSLTGVKTEELEEVKIFFGEDLEYLSERVKDNVDLLQFLLSNHESTFGEKLSSIMARNTHDMPPIVYKQNHDAFANSLKTGYVSIRSLYDAVLDYDNKVKVAAIETKTKKLLKSINA